MSELQLLTIKVDEEDLELPNSKRNKKHHKSIIKMSILLYSIFFPTK